ncbi:MAG: phage integrase SAM-like domain-containing protein [Bacteroidales bacterium]|nr:phage integrase SAM-like domain-containing protein [Bacteroidales bacterium]MBR3096484.1 phage integrase SAM-like domain-containing protein [Bacteroidales bacterium]MBR6865504.1 phage integrase SAM-like domain-containing protein [Bacteroidales bacterium]
MKIKRNVAFKLRAYGKDKSLFQIRLRATFNGQRIDFKTGCQINDKSAWDEGNQLVKDGYKGPKGETALSINTELRNIKDQMESSFLFYEATDKIPSVSELQKTYEDRLQGTIPKRPDPEPKKERKPSNPDFFATFEKFVKEGGEKNAWTEGTFEKWASLKRDLQAFKSSIKFSDLTEPTLTEFVAYLRDNKTLRTPRKKKGDREKYDHDDITGLKNATIEKKLRYLRWYLNWATERGYNTNLTYKTFKPTLKMTQKKVIYLTKEEMTRIRKLELPGDLAYLDPIRDIFLFCCFSGLRHSDVNNLRRSDVKGDHIEITTVKTADSISIELNDITKAILDKYKDIPFKDNKALPNYTNQAMNRDLKELCKLAEINDPIRITSYKGNVRIDEIHPKWELVGTHTGRRSFVVNALSLGIPPNVVMKWTGHSDYKAMKPYIDIVDSIKASSMTKFNGLI